MTISQFLTASSSSEEKHFGFCSGTFKKLWVQTVTEAPMATKFQWELSSNGNIVQIASKFQWQYSSNPD
jgi:hypothetical protein